MVFDKYFTSLSLLTIDLVISGSDPVISFMFYSYSLLFNVKQLFPRKSKVIGCKCLLK